MRYRVDKWWCYFFWKIVYSCCIFWWLLVQLGCWIVVCVWWRQSSFGCRGWGFGRESLVGGRECLPCILGNGVGRLYLGSSQESRNQRIGAEYLIVLVVTNCWIGGILGDLFLVLFLCAFGLTVFQSFSFRPSYVWFLRLAFFFHLRGGRCLYAGIGWQVFCCLLLDMLCHCWSCRCRWIDHLGCCGGEWWFSWTFLVFWSFGWGLFYAWRTCGWRCLMGRLRLRLLCCLLFICLLFGGKVLDIFWWWCIWLICLDRCIWVESFMRVFRWIGNGWWYGRHHIISFWDSLSWRRYISWLCLLLVVFLSIVGRGEFLLGCCIMWIGCLVAGCIGRIHILVSLLGKSFELGCLMILLLIFFIFRFVLSICKWTVGNLFKCFALFLCFLLKYCLVLNMIKIVSFLIFVKLRINCYVKWLCLILDY